MSNPKPKTNHLAVFKFKPGQSGNSLGRPRASQTILKELGYTKPMIAVMVAEIMVIPWYKLCKLADNNKEPVIRVIIANAFRQCYNETDFKYIEPFMKILFGRNIPYNALPPIDNKPKEDVEPEEEEDM